MKTNGMRLGFLRTTTAAALTLLMLVPAAAAQTRRQASQKGGGAATPTAAARAGAAQGATAEPPVDVTKLVPSPRSKALGAAYAAGSLPSPAPLPAGSVEEQAAALAARLAAGDEGSVAALYAAVLAAGFGVREQGGGGVRRPAEGAGQGLAFEAWQLATTAKLYGDGYGVGLGRVAAALAVAEPGFAGAPFAELLVEDVRRAALSENRASRFWALFVVELGRQAEQPYDLLGDDDISRIRLDAVQLSFILTRLAADLHVLSKKGQSAARAEARSRGGARFAAASYGEPLGRATRDAFTFTRASYGREAPAAAPVGAQEAGAAAAQPCQLNEIESIILDYNATATTTAFGSLMGYLEGKGVAAAGKWGGLAGKANIVLTLLKFLATYAAVNAEVTLDGGVLTRTKTTQAGERKMLTAKLVIDTGKWQALNCLRPALNAAGLDFSLPGSGAMAGVRVQWRLIAGGDTRGYLGRVWHTASNVDRILAGKAVENDGGAVVYLDTAAGATRAEDKHHYNYTDDNGESKIPAVGHAQEKDLSKEKLKAVYKPLGVKVEIQVKTMKIKDGKGAAGTLREQPRNAQAALTGDLWGAAVGVGAETAYRANWYPSKEFFFPVKDWAPCDGGWRGTVDVVQERRENVAETKRDPVSGQTRVHTSSRIYEYAAKVNVAPGAEEGTLKATAVAGLSDRTYSFESTMYYEHCGDSRRLFTTDGKWTKYVEGTTVEDDPNLNVHEKSPGLFNLSVGIGGFTAAYTDRQQVSYKNHCEEYCDHKPSDETTKGEETADRVAVMLEDVKADPEDPNTLKGSRTFDEMGFKITVTWNLTRCQ